MTRSFCFWGMTALVATTTLGVAAGAETNTAQVENHSMAVGIELDRLQNEFGVGLNVTSPFFFNDRVAIQAAAIQSFYDGVVDQDSKEEQWVPYQTYKLGVIGAHPVINFIRVYGGGGLVHIVPNDRMSEKSGVTGGYGVFGFQIQNFFIEMGGVGTGANADKVAGKPIYSNGFLSTVGARYYL